ncbi:MAG TPA: SH3 domain-containing protein [bacterium]|nr:SH3 domain-containing protein [bacterium]
MKKLFVCLSVLVSLCAGAAHAEELPYIGKISGTNVNVRSKPDTYREVVCQLGKGDEVNVVGHTGEWCQIEYPAKARVWIFNQFVKDNEVIANNIQAHCGAGENFTVLCKIPNGYKFTVKETMGDWLAIEPPKDATAYVAKRFVQYFSSTAGYEAKKQRVAEAKAAYADAMRFKDAELAQKEAAPRYDEITGRFREIARKYADCDEAEKAQEELMSLRDLAARSADAEAVRDPERDDSREEKREEKDKKKHKFFFFF